MAKPDIRAKRPTETHWQWRSRVLAMEQNERDRSEPLVPQETERHGNYDDDFVMHVETGTLAKTKRNRQTSSLARLWHDGQITDDQYMAALQIARVAEAIERNVSVRCASLEARVDNSSGAKNVLFERLSAVRMEMAYRIWRQRLPMPRRMCIDMVMADRALKVTARVHGMGWPRAKRLLTNALDSWNEIVAKIIRDIDQDDVNSAHQRISRAA